MRCSVASFLRSLRDDASASSAIEYALLGPVLFALIIATIQTALVFIAQQ
ncbi:TadE/TadG family type IV pilus assembly protein, partial [Pseudomonas aeruginosa]